MILSDASLNRLECFLMQEGKVVAYASRIGRYCICIENMETLFVREKVFHLHRSQES